MFRRVRPIVVAAISALAAVGVGIVAVRHHEAHSKAETCCAAARAASETKMWFVAERICNEWLEVLPEDANVKACAATNRARLETSMTITAAFDLLRRTGPNLAAQRLESVDCSIAREVGATKDIAETFIEAGQTQGLQPQLALRLIQIGKCLTGAQAPNEAAPKPSNTP